MKNKNDITKFLGKATFLSMLLSLACITEATSAITLERTQKGVLAEIELAANETYDISQTDNILNIQLSQSNLQDLETIAQILPQYIQLGPTSPDKKALELKLSPDISANSYTKDNKLYIAFETDTDAKVLPQAGPLPTIEISYKAEEDFDRFIIKFPKLPTYRINTGEGKTDLIFAAPFRLKSSSIKNYPQKGGLTFTQREDGQTVLSFPENLKQRYEQNNNLIIDLSSRPSENQNYFSALSNTEGLASGNQEEAPLIKTNSLSFSWNIPVSIGVFKRNGYLWIVFDHPQTFDISELAKEAAPLGTDVIQIPNNMAAIIRLTPQKDANVNIRKEGLLWIVDLYTGHPAVKTKEFSIFPQYDVANNAYLYIPSTSLNQSVSFFDPEIGDIITVLTTDEINTGLKDNYLYPDIEFMSSYNGIASIFNTDDLNAEIGNTGVLIRRTKGSMRISENLDILKRRAKLNQQAPMEDNIFAPIDKELLAQPFNEAQAELENNIAAANKDQKETRTITLATYYLSKGLGLEALQLLEKLGRDNPALQQTPNYHALKGVANFLQRRYSEAMEDFSYEDLANSPEANLWRILTSAAVSPKKEDNSIINSYAYLIKDYPNEVRRRISLVAAEASIQANDDLNLQNSIDIIRNSDNQADSTALVSYYGAKKMEMLGYPLNAIREYRNTALLNSPKYSAYARRDIIKLQTRTNSIKTADAIKEYERLRYAWGETSFKKDILKDLASFYSQAKDYASSLKTLNTLRNMSTSEEQTDITRQMVSIFENVYLGNLDSQMSSLKSLAMYEDYNWLAPLSKQYNQIATKIADRLVAVDLLDRAYEILSAQYQRGGLTAEEKGAIGTRMALINLFQDNPSEAINNLDKSENEYLSPSIINHRRIIRAKALSAMGEPEAALELLRNDFSRNGLLMKGEIYWQNNQWNEAADTIKYLIEKPQPNQKLSEEQQKLILDWATALKKAGRETVIVRLRNAFKPYFDGSIYESAFNVLTETFDENKIDIREIDQAINNISAFSGFAKIYTETLKQGPMSENIK